jgi:hypothetical protein
MLSRLPITEQSLVFSFGDCRQLARPVPSLTGADTYISDMLHSWHRLSLFLPESPSPCNREQQYGKKNITEYRQIEVRNDCRNT